MIGILAFLFVCLLVIGRNIYLKYKEKKERQHKVDEYNRTIAKLIEIKKQEQRLQIAMNAKIPAVKRRAMSFPVHNNSKE